MAIDANTDRQKQIELSNKVLDRLSRNGWSPVPFKHHPDHVKNAIKQCNFRPKAKNCFSNAQKLVIGSLNHNFRYVEGIIASVIPIVHAWVIDENDVHHDITICPAPTIICYKIYHLHQVAENMARTQHFTSINEHWLETMRFAHMFGIDIKLPFAEIEGKIKERWSYLNINRENNHG